MPELKPVAWFCTKDADGKPLLEKFWSTNPRYVEVHSRCDWTAVYTIPTGHVVVPRELLESHIQQLDDWNSAMDKIIGKPIDYRWESLEQLRALLQP